MSYTVSYPTGTLYSKTPITGRFLDFLVYTPIPADSTDNLIVIRRHDWVHRPDNMAYDLYSNELLFWIFGVRNGLKDLVFDIEFGTPLYIPTSTRLTSLGIL